MFTVFDNLPAFPDHHADPDPGSAAVLRARLPHRSGNRALRPPGRWFLQTAVNVYINPHPHPSPHLFSPFTPCYTARPFGNPANVELHRVEPPPANGLARLPRAA